MSTSNLTELIQVDIIRHTMCFRIIPILNKKNMFFSRTIAPWETAMFKVLLFNVPTLTSLSVRMRESFQTDRHYYKITF